MDLNLVNWTPICGLYFLVFFVCILFFHHANWCMKVNIKRKHPFIHVRHIIVSKYKAAVKKSHRVDSFLGRHAAIIFDSLSLGKGRGEGNFISTMLRCVLKREKYRSLFK